ALLEPDVIVRFRRRRVTPAVDEIQTPFAQRQRDAIRDEANLAFNNREERRRFFLTRHDRIRSPLGSAIVTSFWQRPSAFRDFSFHRIHAARIMKLIPLAPVWPKNKSESLRFHGPPSCQSWRRSRESWRNINRWSVCGPR